MSTVGNWRGPDIVKDGLTLYHDPGSPNSFFDKTSTIIKNISGGSSTGNLINGPVYDTSVSGNILCDGTNDYIYVTSTTYKSICIWLRRTSSAANKYLLDARPASSAGFIYTGGFGSDWNLMYINGVLQATTIGNIPLNQWTCIYLRNVNTITGDMTLFSRFTGSEVMPGNIAIVLFYNKELTPTEILQNYNATKGRFGL